VRDLAVLRQIAAYLDGWGGLRARVVTEDVNWPSVHLQASDNAHTWQCEHDWWTGQVFEGDASGTPSATIQTTIPTDATASEVADGIRAIYRLLRTEREAG
jgi:hypothetical protein